ncbi:MAG: sulfatase-like hydrolase/transferase [Candidatus Micrarchaeaceae archaeon]
MNSENIVFMMLDTVRADFISPYGGDMKASNLDRLARNGTRYDMAIAPGTYTLPSHLSLFTGKRVRSIPWLNETGMRFSDMKTDPLLRKSKYESNDLTIARIMEYFGYRSALFSNNPFVSEPTGLANGFSYVSNIFIDNKLNSNKASVKAVLHLIQNDSARKNLIRLAYGISSVIPEKRLDRMYLELRKRLNRHFSREYGYYSLDKGANETNRQLDAYLKSNRSKRNFIFMNYMEGHEGYPTNLVTGDYVEQDKWLHMIGEADEYDLNATKDAYRKRIEYLDAKVGDAIGIMKKRGLLDDATLIVSSDHGQAFMEHGEMFHNVFPYNEVARVPLIVSEFRSGRQVRESKVIERPFSLTELNSMIAGKFLAKAGNPVVSDHTGITEVWDTYLLKLFKKRSKNASRMYRKKVEQDNPATAVYHEGYKLIHYYGKRKDELYCMSSDKGEVDNIIQKEKGIAYRLLACNKAAS